VDDARTGPVQLLWTGGWDSSFRLLQLLLVERRAVQPIYVVDTDRGSLVYELRTMEAIRTQVLPRLTDPGLLRPVQIILATDYPPRRELADLRDRIGRHHRIGSQYVWLAGVAEALGWRDVEMCTELSRPGGFSGFGSRVFDPQGTLNGSPESELFRYWSFPLLTKTKADLRREAERDGFLDLLLQRWFCFDPLAGKPCGRCQPCRNANRDGIEFANRPAVLARAGRRAAGRTVHRLARHIPGTPISPVEAGAATTGKTFLTGAARPVYQDGGLDAPLTRG
jgi:hypothetical protein